MTAPRNRVQSGVPTGGQFSPKQQAESDIELPAEQDIEPTVPTFAPRERLDWDEDDYADGTQFAHTHDGYLLTVSEKDMGYDDGPIYRWESRHEHSKDPLRALAHGHEKTREQAQAAARSATTDGLPDDDTDTPRVPKQTWLDDGFMHTVQTARTHIPITKKIAVESAWSGFAVVRHTDGHGATSYRCFSGDAWTRPEQQPLLPWAAPEGEPVAFVDMDGRVSAITEDHDPRRL